MKAQLDSYTGGQMKNRVGKQVIHMCVLLAILSCLPSIGTLTWVECIRVLVILLVLTVLVIRHSRSVIRGHPVRWQSAHCP